MLLITLNLFKISLHISAKEEPCPPVKKSTNEPQKVKIKVEKMSDDEEMEVHIYPRLPVSISVNCM